MSDETTQPEPQLSPKEQLEQDQGRVQLQLTVTDVTETVNKVMDTFGFGGGGTSGRTSFEGHDLNAMIDMIENSNPEHLESAGKALWDARDAIKEAAHELEAHIAKVEWEGESGTAFRDWGTGLVAHARKLGDFADGAGTQITVAGTGLASVRSSLPPRDSRLVRKKVDEIELPARLESNPEYTAAVKVEKDRQEAINQANRLASYYSVSEESLAAQEPPRFDRALDVAMPRPSLRSGTGSESGTSGSGAETSSGSYASGVESPQRAGGDVAGSAGAPGVDRAGAVTPVPERSVSTEIDSVSAPPAPVATPTPSPSPVTTGTPGPSGGPIPPFTNGFANPVQSGSSRATSSSGGSTRTPLGKDPAATGRSATAGPAPTANGRSAPPVGRPGYMGGGPAGAGTTGGQSPMAGRPSGVTGGRPVAGPGGTATPSGHQAGRGAGIVGGTPQRAASASGTSGGRSMPRGSVIGAAGAAQARTPAGSTGQRGVIGAGGTNSASRSGGRGTPSANGVVGTPRGSASGSGRGFTTGGAGLVRGHAGQRGPEGEDEETTGSTRPDYLTEDEETWVARRGAVPPVVE
ncbi:hypothetical protein [Streptomyces sp. NPDC048560]|uniref:hypothetical protein n=1 Tax=Streptomyces sp. NPDC048560 TaxID=3155488 RepID=UPI00342B9FD7